MILNEHWVVILKEQFERVSQLDGMANCLFELAGE